ncbi:hypothetical protein UFOVP838_51 [uncultured Caudovirales phage]|jgi:hypothetical protein|uniref:Uncharacterized protein n=1 Tax=uncultured Caudovirales phage TaxID=2100421 RepID=A0A6J5PI85_9CAUD|nr:hypothetical protein UFOVP838_51 [uncultured Caudovirales phage]CAB4171610.1 hypothetical protein UFOVP932_16 [uncultured Caudovirales phage]CAB4177533.1 hypothetical protein UFOVP1010_4 [uncultured Caudovirales phage]CAB4201982.1 hypothetical protein UFOVP1359_45 [uncultured Caudovirales phage]
MEMQNFINLLGGAALSVLGWFARQLWDAMKELRGDLHVLEVNLPENYAKRDDLNKRMDHIESMFQRIYDKLDAKADK